MPQPDEIIRACVDTWNQQQEAYTAQLSESLHALEAYEQYLQNWQDQLAGQAEELSEQTQHLEEQRQDLEQRRNELIRQQATDVAMTAELDQARAELEELRQRLASRTAPAGATTTTASDQSMNPTLPAKNKSGLDLLEPAMNSVAKQFHKLRQQQAARRSTARSGEDK